MKAGGLMAFSQAQIIRAIEEGLQPTSNSNPLRVVQISCEDLDWHGLSANTFARCKVRIIADQREQWIDLIIKRWVPGGPTDIVMGLDPLPRESLAFSAGIFTDDLMPLHVNAPFVAVLDDRDTNQNWLVMHDVSAELAAFNSLSDLSEIHRHYDLILDQIALMHASWEKPSLQARLDRLPW